MDGCDKKESETITCFRVTLLNTAISKCLLMFLCFAWIDVSMIRNTACSVLFDLAIFQYFSHKAVSSEVSHKRS